LLMFRSCFLHAMADPSKPLRQTGGTSTAVIVGLGFRVLALSGTVKLCFDVLVQENFDKREKKKAQITFPLRHFFPLKVVK
jgi:hypothetical protein